MWLPRGKGTGGGMEWEFGLSRCKLLYIEWMDNKILLYSTGNYIQYCDKTITEKNTKKNVYMYN